jgi:hypothetical protein
MGSKKAGVLPIVNELFGMYFRLNILRLCKNLIRPVESRKLHEHGTMGQLVTYRYYSGRLNMFEDQHGQAEQNLDYAFQHCHKNAIGNKRRILRYLVPIKMYRGKLPTPQCKYRTLVTLPCQEEEISIYATKITGYRCLSENGGFLQCSRSTSSTSSNRW